jgi:hypothetical protein
MWPWMQAFVFLSPRPHPHVSLFNIALSPARLFFVQQWKNIVKQWKTSSSSGKTLQIIL